MVIGAISDFVLVSATLLSFVKSHFVTSQLLSYLQMARETPDFSGTSSKYPIRQKRPVINVIVTGDLTGVVSILFHYLRKIVVYRVELQCVGLAPCDSKVKGFSCTACPEDHFVPLTAHPVQVIDQAHIRFSGIRPIAVTEGSVEIDRNDLMIQIVLPSVIFSDIPFCL